MKKFNKIFCRLLSALILTAGMIACSSSPKGQAETQEKTNPESSVYDSTRIQIDITKIDSIKLIITDDESESMVKEEDWKALAEAMSTARYDTAWNDKDIMVKMVAPDYTLILQYKGETLDNSDWLMLWKENGRTKYKNKWFFLDNKQESVYQLLENYRKSGNKN